MEAVANLPVAVPDHLVEDLLKRLPFVSEEITSARLVAGGTQVAFELRAGCEQHIDSVAAHIIDVAEKLCRSGGTQLVRVLAQQLCLPSSFDQDPHPQLEHAGELVRFGRGRYALGPRLTALVAAFEARLCRLARAFDASARTFPALIGADVLDRCRYLRNFPTALSLVAHLREDHVRLQEFARNARWDGEGLAFDGQSLSRIECVLSPAVCFHWYASLADSSLPEASSITAVGKCFRYESSNLAGLERLWDFTMREIVFAGPREFVLGRRQLCIEACTGLMEELGLAYELSTATDPFFVDAYAMQAAYQQGFELKLELRLPLPYAGRSLAVGSLNYHQDFFGRSFAIEAGGAGAHTCCLGFGLERLALAFVAQHGVDERGWPAPVREWMRRSDSGV